MRQPCLLCLILLLVPQVWAQPSSKSKKPAINCETICAELFAAIRANPDNLSMRLEEALIIKESCAAELVTTAITAVNAEPAMVRKIQETALEIAPGRQAVIAAAVRNYKAPVVAAATPVVVEEVRRAVLPEVVTAKAGPGEEIRRAQLPDTMVAQQAVPALDLMNVPKARPLK
ncbi:hypothetical protein [Prosthecobacter sp.]|jgi:hypothetical protein|uniref:hypothetical protein n=1 Tax=Prosthecobacter sp. TaxID=1965333 RepID=UPI003784BFC7